MFHWQNIYNIVSAKVYTGSLQSLHLRQEPGNIYQKKERQEVTSEDRVSTELTGKEKGTHVLNENLRVCHELSNWSGKQIFAPLRVFNSIG